MSIEQRLERDIAAVAESVVITDRDLLLARSAIDERVDAGRGRDRRRTVAVVAAAAVLVAGVGFTAIQTLGEDEAAVTPAGGGQPTDRAFADFLTGAAPTPENLNGFWRVDNGTTMVRFGEDGTVQFSASGEVISSPDSAGTYQIDGDRISVTFTASGVAECGPFGDPLTMRAALPEPGLVNIVLPDRRLGTCDVLTTKITLEHVLPTDSALADLSNSGVGGWKPVTDEAALLGDWMAEGGGYLLEIAEDGTYYVAGGSAEVVDNGYWRFRRSALELFSRVESPRCDEGDWLILGGVQAIFPGTTVIRGTVEQNDCGGRWTPERWIRMPDTSPSDTSGS
jgi:hypothetical protein